MSASHQSQVLPAAASYSIKDPTGHGIIRVPETAAEDRPYFTVDQRSEIRKYYDEYGYVVVRNLIPREVCTAALRLFQDEVKPSNSFIYRQTTANPERHVLTSHGFVLNPILNVQSLDAREFPRFRDVGMSILTHPNTQAAVKAILGEPGKIVQTMYFDGNPTTWPHQDTYYLDAEEIGRMTAAWFAVEDIAPGAGRFFVYPKSNRIDMRKNGGDFDIAFNHARYKKLVVDVIREHGLECRAPALQQGDAMFWAAKTIHGSLGTSQPERSRSSFTAHYIPESSRLIHYQTKIRRLNLERISGMSVHKPKDLSRPLNRTILWVETTFPRSFQLAKKIAIKALVN